MLERQIVADHGAGKYRSRLVMSTNIRQAILARNQELRKDPAALKKLDWGRWVLSIPHLDLFNFKKRHPDLFDGPPEDRKQALAKFMASPESEPYKVRG